MAGLSATTYINKLQALRWLLEVLGVQWAIAHVGHGIALS